MSKLAARIITAMVSAFAIACVVTAYPFLLRFTWYVRLLISFVIFLIAQGFGWLLARGARGGKRPI